MIKWLVSSYSHQHNGFALGPCLSSPNKENPELSRIYFRLSVLQRKVIFIEFCLKPWNPIKCNEWLFERTDVDAWLEVCVIMLISCCSSRYVRVRHSEQLWSYSSHIVPVIFEYKQELHGSTIILILIQHNTQHSIILYFSQPLSFPSPPLHPFYPPIKHMNHCIASEFPYVSNFKTTLLIKQLIAINLTLYN